jgi:hypothetical protein
VKNAYKTFRSESLKGRDHSKDIGVDGKIIRILKSMIGE